MLKKLSGSTKDLSVKHSTKVQKKYNMTSLPSTSQDCVEYTFLPKKCKIYDYFTTDAESRDLILLQMIAEDGFSFNVYTTSTDLRNFIDFIV